VLVVLRRIPAPPPLYIRGGRASPSRGTRGSFVYRARLLIAFPNGVIRTITAACGGTNAEYLLLKRPSSVCAQRSRTLAESSWIPARDNSTEMVSALADRLSRTTARLPSRKGFAHACRSDILEAWTRMPWTPSES